MAILKIGKPISTPGHLARAVDYSMNAEKTLVNEHGMLQRVVEYSTNEQKTLHGEQLVNGINCDPDNAAREMIATKERYGKTGGRLAYHFFLSYQENEVTPQIAHEIGMKWAGEYFNDFEVVVSTHCNTDNIHNDIVVNSVSFVDGHKFDNTRKDLYDMRSLVNQLCEEYNISKIPDRNRTRENSFDPAKHFRGAFSHKQQAIQDIEYSISQSFSVSDIYIQLENRGYTVDWSPKHPTLIADGWKRPYRFSTLGYTRDELHRRAEDCDRRMRRIGLTLYPTKPIVFVKRAREHRRPITYFGAMYLHWLYILGKAKKCPSFTAISPAEYKKFNYYKQQIQFLSDRNIATKSEAVNVVDAINGQLKTLDVERFRLQGAKKKYKVLFEAHATYMRYSPMREYLDIEQQQKLAHALDIMKAKGYEGKPEKVEEMRKSIMTAILENKDKAMPLKHDRKMLQSILNDHDRIKKSVMGEVCENRRMKALHHERKPKAPEYIPASKPRSRSYSLSR